MESNIPTPEQVKAELDGLSHAQIKELASMSGVPFNTLWNVRGGATKNPGLSAVSRFFPLIRKLKGAVV